MDCFGQALKYLSPKVRAAAEALPRGLVENVCEIRLRRDLPMSFSTYDGAVFVSSEGRLCKSAGALVTHAQDMEYTVNRLCAGSLYRHEDTIKKGYIVTPEGLRAGICGTAVYENGRLMAVDGYTAVNLRIPHNHAGCEAPIMRDIVVNGLRSMLIFSPPGVGKTTLIRNLARAVSAVYLTSVVDEKGEILPLQFMQGCVMCDILRGYTKPEGMEIAVRTLSPQVIICDEIGMADDVSAILSVQNSGAKLIATAHASSISQLMAKPNIKLLCDAGVFESFVRLEKSHDGMKIIFEGD